MASSHDSGVRESQCVQERQRYEAAAPQHVREREQQGERDQREQLVAVLKPTERQLCVDWSLLSTGACSARVSDEVSLGVRSAAAADCAAVAGVLFRYLTVERQQAVRRSDGEWESVVDHVVPRIVRTILHTVLAVLHVDEGEYIAQAKTALVNSAMVAEAQLQGMESRWHVVWILLLVFTSGGRYDARMRGFLRGLCRLYDIPLLKLLAAEALRLDVLGQLLHQCRDLPGHEASIDAASVGQPSGRVHQSGFDERWSTGRTLKVGGAALAGSAALFFSGGAAAPALGGALGAVGAGEVLAAAGGAKALLGAAGAGLSAAAVKNLTGNVHEFVVEPTGCRMHRHSYTNQSAAVSCPEPEPELECVLQAGKHLDKASMVEAMRESGDVSDAECTALLAVFAKEQAEGNSAMPDRGIGTRAAVSLASHTAQMPVKTPITPGASSVGSDSRRASTPVTPSAADFPSTGSSGSPSTSGLAVVIGVSGWLADSQDSFEAQWSWLSADLRGHECKWVRWESDTLKDLGQQFQNFVKSKVHQNVGYTVAQEITVGMEMLEFAMVEAFAWPVALLTAATYIDNAWSMACSRAIKAGRILAATLLAHKFGHRPVTLCGYSTGALLIWTCLEELTSAPDGAGEAIIESVFLLGAPVTASAQSWAKVRKIVAGRLVNGYNRGDWVLWMLQRSIGGALVGEIAGLSPVADDVGVESVDVSLLLLEEKRQGHRQYRSKFRRVFQALGLGGDQCELLWALKKRRQEAQDELSATVRRIGALEREQERRRQQPRAQQ